MEEPTTVAAPATATMAPPAARPSVAPMNIFLALADFDKEFSGAGLELFLSETLWLFFLFFLLSFLVLLEASGTDGFSGAILPLELSGSGAGRTLWYKSSPWYAPQIAPATTKATITTIANIASDEKFPSLSVIITGLFKQYANIFLSNNPCPVCT